MILTAGYNVYPAELERVLCMHPAVSLAATGVPDEVKGAWPLLPWRPPEPLLIIGPIDTEGK